VGTELRVTLPGPDGAADARRALAVLEKLITLLGQVEDVALKKHAARGDERTVWGFTSIGIGSLTATLAPNRPKRGATSATLADVAAMTVAGLETAENRDGLPEHWDRHAGSTAADLAQLLGMLPSDGLRVELLSDGEPVRDVVMTRRAGEHLRAGLKVRRQSIGSLIGRLDTASLHERREAGLWLERGGERVAIHFRDDQIDVIRRAWGRRVEVAGRVVRDVDGRALSLQMKSLEILPDTGQGRPLTDLVGLDANLTGGQDPHDYLREIRGAS
jgi:hypothetical protein